MFVTASNDQTLKSWHITIDLEKDGVKGVDIARGQSVSSSIADISSMDVFAGEDGEKRVVLAGIGMEVWKISSLDFELERQ